MKHAIEHGPSFAWLRVQLEAGESIDAEAGSMVTQSPTLALTTRLATARKAGFLHKLTALVFSLGRRLFGKESMFLNTFSGPQGGEVVLAPKLAGHIMHQSLGGGGALWVQAGSYLASTPGVQTKVRWGGLRGLFGGEGITLLHCTGQGELWVNAYGGITPVEVDGSYRVDTGHIVAFDGALDFKIKSVGGFKSLLFSGEGLVCEFQGKGRVWIQSRNIGALVGWITPLLR